MAKSVIQQAIERGTPADLKAALVAGGSVHGQDKWKDYPIELAARKADPEFTRILLAAGADPNKKSTDRTALMAAAERGYVENVRLLLGAGAKIDARGMNNRTALGFAASGGHAAVVRLLLEHGAKPNLAEIGGHTPLMHAAVSGSAEAAAALISAGAKLDVADEEGGWTALMWASMRGRLPVVKVLCEAGANTELRDKKKKTAVQLAQASKRATVVKYLSKASNAEPDAAPDRGRKASPGR